MKSCQDSFQQLQNGRQQRRLVYDNRQEQGQKQRHLPHQDENEEQENQAQTTTDYKKKYVTSFLEQQQQRSTLQDDDTRQAKPLSPPLSQPYYDSFTSNTLVAGWKRRLVVQQQQRIPCSFFFLCVFLFLNSFFLESLNTLKRPRRSCMSVSAFSSTPPSLLHHHRSYSHPYPDTPLLLGGRRRIRQPNHNQKTTVTSRTTSFPSSMTQRWSQRQRQEQWYRFSSHSPLWMVAQQHPHHEQQQDEPKEGQEPPQPQDSEQPRSSENGHSSTPSLLSHGNATTDPSLGTPTPILSSSTRRRHRRFRLRQLSSTSSSSSSRPNRKQRKPKEAVAIATTTTPPLLPRQRRRRHFDPRSWPAVRIYTEYAGRLWNETNTEARQRIARDKVAAAVKQVQHILLLQQQEQEQQRQQQQQSAGNPTTRAKVTRPRDSDHDDPEKVQALLQACQDFLQQHEQQQQREQLDSLPPPAPLNAAMDAATAMETNEEELVLVPILNDDDDHNDKEKDFVISSILATSEESKDPSLLLLEPTTTTATTITPTNPNGSLPMDIARKGGSTNKAPSPSMQEQKEQQQKAKIEPSPSMTKKTGPENSTPIAMAVAEKVAATAVSSSSSSSPSSTKPKRGRRSILFGAMMGLVVAGWVFSGNYIFTGLFTLMTILGQLEYYRMVINTGVYPARRISVVGACSMFLTALFCPQHHQIILPLFGLYAMIWFLTMKRSVTTIPEIATTFTGMFYLGYVPSFWVRTRLIGTAVAGSGEPTRLAPVLGPWLQVLQQHAQGKLPAAALEAIHVPITTGAIFIFWTWLSLAFSDVAAYFVGKNMGRTPLKRYAPAAGATSPNKTVEGVIGGCVVSALLSMCGAWVQKWPYWAITGMIHGTLLGLIGLIGDLTASMIKRDAGIKDFGDILPEHGGILDRVDSFVWSAPYSWLVCHTIIPALKTMVRGGGP